MKIAVINFSGNVGKTTVARHLLRPRIDSAELIAVESVNADEGQGPALRGRQFAELQEYLQTIDNAVVDIGASNVEELLGLMQRYRGVAMRTLMALWYPRYRHSNNSRTPIATLVELERLGVPAAKIRLVFNMLDNQPRR